MIRAFVFPGQGSQVVGMGRDLYESSAPARAVFDTADATLGFALSRCCFEGPAEELTATRNAQPAILTTSVATLATLAGAPQVVAFVAHHAGYVAGHSLGEYTAAVAAGALGFTDALRLVRLRGELMARAHEGTMAAAIGIDEATLEQVCREASREGEPVVIANYNAPDQLVISGAAAAVARASAMARAAGARRVLPLKVSAAFHSPLMEAPTRLLRPALEQAPFADAQLPLISNTTATPLMAAHDVRHELIEQATAPVRWVASVQALADAAVDTFVEIGPGSVLTGLIRRSAPTARLINVNDLASARALGDLLAG